VGQAIVSNAGGLGPQWRGDGKELFYTSMQTPAKIMAVDIEAKDGAIVAGMPHPLFETRLSFLRGPVKAENTTTSNGSACPFALDRRAMPATSRACDRFCCIDQQPQRAVH